MEKEDDEVLCNNCKRPVSSDNFATHSAFCNRHIFVCRICDEPIKISEKNQHLEEYHVSSACDLCELPLEKWMLPKHMESCPKRLVECEYCEADCPFDKFSEHVEFCGSRTEKCLLCREYIMLKNKAKHNELHMCERKFRSKSVDEEIKQNKVNEVISKGASAERTVEISEAKRKFCSEKERGGLDIDMRKRADESFTNKSRSNVRTEDQNLKVQIPEGAVASLPDKTNENSKHYTECHICKQSIRWIDMNTHVPSCASSAGKCSVCAEDVPSYKLKEHMNNHLQNKSQKPSLKATQNDDRDSEMNRIRSVGSYTAKSREPEITDGTVKCPYCYQLCSEDRILFHTRNCLKNVYECPLCNERVPEMCRVKHETSECRIIQESDKPNRSHFSRGSSQGFFECPLCTENVPEDDRDKHVSFECKSLMNSGGTHGLYGMRDDESDVYQCPLCLENMLQKDKARHDSFECKILIENSGVDLYESYPEVPKKTCGCSDSASYAQVTKKRCGCSCKGNQTSEICPTCKNRIPQNKRAEHIRNCQRKKFPCLHCNQMIDAACEKIHLQSCPALHENRSYKDLKTRVYHTRSSTFEHGGAIPKNVNIKDMIRPRTAKCMYCQTTLNADIVKYHEEECVQRPIACPNCSDPLLLKELGTHSCKKKKGKNHKGNRQASEEKDTPSVAKKFFNFFGLQGKREEDKSGDVNRHYPYLDTPSNYPYPRYNQDEVGNQNRYFPDEDNTLIPCEFCSKKFPASELVLHETGCQPALVSFAKPSSPEDAYQSKLSSGQKDNVDSSSQNVRKTDIKSPPFTETSSFFPSTKFERIKDRESDAKPGEFLKYYSKTSTEHHKYPKRNENAAVEKKTEPLSLQSVWNVKSTNDFNAEDYDDSKQISEHSDGEMDVDQTESSYMNKRERRRLKEYEKLDNDSEMTEFFNFLEPNGSKNIEFDEEHEIISSANDEKAVPKSLETDGALDSNVSDNDAQDKHQKDLDLLKKTTIGRYEKMCKESSTYIDNTDKDQKEYVSSSRTLKDFKFGTHETRVSSSEDNVYHTAVLEKNSEEPEKLCEEKSSRHIDSDMDEKKYVSSFTQRLSAFKFSAHNAGSLSSEDNVQHNALLEKKNQKPENLCEQKPSSYLDSAKNDEEYVNDCKRLLNFKFGTHKAKFLSSEDNVHHTTLLEETEKVYVQKPSRSVDDCKNVKEHLSNFRQHMSDFKFDTHEARSSEGDVCLTEENEEKNGFHDKRAFNLEAVLQETNRNTISDKLENLYKPASRLTDDANKNYKECVTNSRYISDIKFGANKASEDNVHHTYLPDEIRAFKIEPAQELLKDAKLPICKISSKQAKKLEDLDEKIANLHKRNSAAAGEKDDVTKWKKWREVKQSYSSGSE